MGKRKGQTTPRCMHTRSETGYSLREEWKPAALQRSFRTQLHVMERERKRARKQSDFMLAGVSFSLPFHPNPAILSLSRSSDQSFKSLFCVSGVYKHEVLLSSFIINTYGKALVYLQSRISSIAFESMFMVWHLLPSQPQLSASTLLTGAWSSKSRSLALSLLGSKHR